VLPPDPPVGPTDAKLPVAEVHVDPLKRDHLTAPKSRLTVQQRHRMGARVEIGRRFDELFVLVEIVESRIANLEQEFARPSPFDLAGSRRRVPKFNVWRIPTKYREFCSAALSKAGYAANRVQQRHDIVMSCILKRSPAGIARTDSARSTKTRKSQIGGAPTGRASERAAASSSAGRCWPHRQSARWVGRHSRERAGCSASATIVGDGERLDHSVPDRNLTTSWG